jgi:hypothetical protein
MHCQPQASCMQRAWLVAAYWAVLVHVMPKKAACVWSQVACARKECEAAAEQQEQQQQAPEATMPPGSTGAGPSGSSSSGCPRQLQRMYVSQLPEGTCLYPGSPLARAGSASAGGSMHGGRGGGAQSGDWVDIALHPELHAGPSGAPAGSREARGGLQALQVEEGRGAGRRWWPRGGVAYMGSGVYLWGAPRDTQYRERVHGPGSAGLWA